MANLEQVERLKQGVTVWNQWQMKYPLTLIDLNDANLQHTDLRGAVFQRATLNNANLSRARLGSAVFRCAYLIGTDLSGAKLNGADFDGAILNIAILDDTTLRGASFRDARLGKSGLNNADLRDADFRRANLSGARLCYADLSNADLSNVDLRDADLSGANLSNVNLSGANLTGTNFSGVYLWGTIFARNDLRVVKGLEAVIHNGPSTVDVKTVVFPQGKVLVGFLQGTGFPEPFIRALPSLLTMSIEYPSCVLSYSSKDETFAQQLYADLQNEGVRCWFAPENLKIGDKFRSHIDEAIHQHDKLLLILSEQATASTRVESEVEAALEKEDRGEKRLVLFPIRIDESVLTTREAWAANLRRIHHIGDFTDWTNPVAYQQTFQRLLRDLKAEQG